MPFETFPLLGSDGLTAAERNRKLIRDVLRGQLPDKTDDEVWQLTLALSEQVPFALPPNPTSLTYAWSDGQTLSMVDRATGVPEDARERALLRALLVHALREVDAYEGQSQLGIYQGINAVPCFDSEAKS